MLGESALPEPTPTVIFFETSAFANKDIHEDGPLKLQQLRDRLRQQGYVPLKLGDTVHDGWSRRFSGANWKDDLWMRSTSTSTITEAKAHMKPPPALLFDMTSPMDAVQLDEQVVTSSGCPPPHCRWHWHYVVEPLEKAVQVVSGRGARNETHRRAFTPTACVCFGGE